MPYSRGLLLIYCGIRDLNRYPCRHPTFLLKSYFHLRQSLPQGFGVRKVLLTLTSVPLLDNDHELIGALVGSDLDAKHVVTADEEQTDH